MPVLTLYYDDDAVWEAPPTDAPQPEPRQRGSFAQRKRSRKTGNAVPPQQTLAQPQPKQVKAGSLPWLLAQLFGKKQPARSQRKGQTVTQEALWQTPPQPKRRSGAKGATVPVGQPVQRYQARRQHYQKERLLTALARLLRLGVVIAAPFAVMTVLQANFWSWHTNELHVHGDADNLKAGVIEHLMQPYEGQSLLAINPQRVEDAMRQAVPLLAHVQVRRHWLPASVQVFVTEHKPWLAFYAKTNEGTIDAQPFAVATQQKTIVPLQAEVLDVPHLLASYPTVPLFVYPATLDNLTRNPETLALWLQRLDTLTQRYKNLDKLTLTGLSLKDSLTEGLSIVAHFEGLDVLIGPMDDTSLARASRLNALLPTLLEQWPNVDRVDLRWEKTTALRRRPDSKA
jgi:cell division septal protein FtsQ